MRKSLVLGTKEDVERRRRKQYKSRADDVLLSRSYKNQTSAGLKCNSPQSDQSIFDMLSTCFEKQVEEVVRKPRIVTYNHPFMRNY